ncbi:MAG: Ubiquinone biosynthesis O-methyltransferase [Verrucomicrobiota bacterium]|jgi:SAM-dependent methyltransferase
MTRIPMDCPVCESKYHSAVSSKNGYDIHRCPDCGLLFIHPFPSPEELSDFYSNYHKSKQYEDKIASKIKRARKRIRSLGRPGGRTLLDVGCNLGFAAEAGKSLGYRALGIDIDEDAIERAKVAFPECHFRAMSINELAEGGERFDTIYCSEVIEHLVDPLNFLLRIKTVMSDGGVLFMTTPDVGHYSLPKDVGKLVEWATFRPPEHLLYFDRKSLGRLFVKAGFREVGFKFSFKPTLKIIART